MLEEVSSSDPSRTENHRGRQDAHQYEQLIVEQMDGELQVTHIPTHSKTEPQIRLLVKYLALLRKQIPNMPQNYLVASLFSSDHESLLLVQRGQDGVQLCAGLTFRELYGKRLMELSLMASCEFKRGFGSILVNYLKRLAQQRKIEVITTHADNTAIGFYEKMGFSVRELVEKSELGEKKFSDSTVMQTAIEKNIDYFAMRGFLKRQRQLLTHELHNGSFDVFTIADSNQPKLVGSEYFRIDPKDIKEVDNFDKEYQRLIHTKQQRTYRRHLVYLNRLLAIAHPEVIEMRQELQSLPWLEYHEPIELMTIKEKVLEGKYETKGEMVEDLVKLLANCHKFYANHPLLLANLHSLELELESIKQEL